MVDATSFLGGNSKAGREDNDHYPTPPEPTVAFMEKEQHFAPSTIFEPFVGKGDMAEEIRRYDRKIIGSDIKDYGYPGTIVKDFLEIPNDMKGKDVGIISNPPFNIAEKVIRHAREDMHIGYVALLLKSTYLAAKCRVNLFNEHQPSRIYQLTWRPDFLGKKKPVMECAWFVWDDSRLQQETYYYQLTKPQGRNQ